MGSPKKNELSTMPVLGTRNANIERVVHSKKSIPRMKTAFIGYAEANFRFVVAIFIELN
jgi:hypothetical protein